MTMTSIDLELALLKACFDDNDRISLFPKNIFISKQGEVIFKALKQLRLSDEKINIDSLFYTITRDNPEITKENIESINLVEYNSDSINTYIKELTTYHLQDSLRTSFGKDLNKELNTSNEEIASNIQKEIHLSSNTEKKVYTLEELLDKYEEELKKRYEGKGSYPTGDPYLDKYYLAGYSPGYMTTIFGASGGGKSTFALNNINCRINRNLPTVYNSLEMDKISSLDRLMALRTGIPIEFFMNKDRKRSEFKEALEKVRIEKLKLNNNNSFRFIEDETQSIDDLDLMIPDLLKSMKTNYFTMVIDLATMLQDFKKAGHPPTIYENAVDRLHSLARKYGIHFVNVVQSLRDSHDVKIKGLEDIEKFRPRLDRIKNSSAFEERSRLAISTFRPYYYASRYMRDDPILELMDDIMEIDFLKQSMSDNPRLKYLFRGDIASVTRFEDNKGE